MDWRSTRVLGTMTGLIFIFGSLAQSLKCVRVSVLSFLTAVKNIYEQKKKKRIKGRKRNQLIFRILHSIDIKLCTQNFFLHPPDKV